jgi:two-component system response regulator AlgR
MTLRLYIVDDEAPARSRLKALLSDIAQECPHQLVGEAGHAQAALDGIAASAPDIVLLDVQMPGMNGIELAEHLIKNTAAPPAVIFVTAYDEYALKAFDVQALDYLLKPVRAARLAESLKRASASRAPAQARAILQAARKHFSVLERGRVLLVPVAEVLYLRAQLKYVTLHTRGRDYLTEESLTSIEDEMGSIFVRVHRNALVARNAIIGVERGVPVAEQDGEHEGAQDRAHESWQVILAGVDERLPISRRQWPVIKALVR